MFPRYNPSKLVQIWYTMATKFRRGKVWYVKYKDIDGIWKNISCGKQANATDAEHVRKRYEGKELNELHNAPIRIVAPDLQKALEKFSADILPQSQTGRIKSIRGLKRERTVIDNFRKWTIENDVSSFEDSLAMVFDYFSHLESAGKAQQTRREERRLLRKFWSWCISQHYCRLNPVDKIPNPAKPKSRPRFFSEGELSLIFATAKSPWREIYQFLYLTGLRIGELGNLEWKDILEDQKLLIVRVLEGNKTKREDAVPLCDDAVRVVQWQKQWCAKMATDDSKRYVFTNCAGLKLDNDNIYRHLIRQTLHPLGILDASPHTFRHTCASHLVIKGVSLYIVKEILRHASIKETEIYAHLSKEAVSTAMQRLSLCFPSKPTPQK